MTINDEILAIANQLANQGKKPTVALIKTRLSQPVPLPQLITTLKNWQHEPDFTEVNPVKTLEADEVQEQNEELVEIVNQAIAPLKAEINALKSLIEQLMNKS
jgi:anti-sigma factor ChrR (cupin superfamily)